jgi:pimeloyl-ACP methyl ester carboxylesterase
MLRTLGVLLTTKLFLIATSLFSIVTAQELHSRYIREDTDSISTIVFVHGVIGDSTTTWTNDDTKTYWPDMLTRDPAFNDYNIYVYEYPTPLLKTSFSIDEIAENMRLQFNSDGISDSKNIIFIAHSMGGIAVRAYLLKYRAIANQVRFIYFYSTPTTGSEIASIVSFLGQNPQFGKLTLMKSEDYLADVQRGWLAASFPIPSYCAYEKQSTYGFLIVTQGSASALCTKPLDPIDTNHIDIVKPRSTRDTPYLSFKNAFRETMKDKRSDVILLPPSAVDFRTWLSPEYSTKERFRANSNIVVPITLINTNTGGGQVIASKARVSIPFGEPLEYSWTYLVNQHPDQKNIWNAIEKSVEILRIPSGSTVSEEILFLTENEVSWKELVEKFLTNDHPHLVIRIEISIVSEFHSKKYKDSVVTECTVDAGRIRKALEGAIRQGKPLMRCGAPCVDVADSR